MTRPSCEIAVIGGGPSGAVVAMLLASRGHDVRVLTRLPDTGRALANSLPPSTRKLLTQVGILDLVEAVGFPTTGNTVWWGRREGQAEPFAPDGSAYGYQVARARLDPLLLARAEQAGARVVRDVRVTRVSFATDRATVQYSAGQDAQALAADLVLDCSGRAGVVPLPLGLRRHLPGGRMQALVGEWSRADAWRLDEPSHTYIETCGTGWAWSIPISRTTRHLGAMIDGATSHISRGPDLESTYRAQVARTPRLASQVDGARLDHVFACDASIYDAAAYAGDRFLLVGDAATTLNPLSSFGIKKALASAWLAAIAVHTARRRPARRDTAFAFFARREDEVWQVNQRATRDFAREAWAEHATPFWEAQATAAIDEARIPPGDADRLAQPAVRDALERLRASADVRFVLQPDRLTSAPVVRGFEIVDEDAVRLGTRAVDVVRYVRGVDLVALARLAAQGGGVGALLERYGAEGGTAPLHDVVGALSLLVATSVLVMDEG